MQQVYDRIMLEYRYVYVPATSYDDTLLTILVFPDHQVRIMLCI